VPLNLAFTALALVAWTTNVYLTDLLGLNDFSRLNIKGEYKVGVRHIRTSKLQVETTVFYPID